MIRNYFKASFRQLTKHKLTTTISVLGLALSMICGLIVFEYVRFEKSFDNYHPKSETTYRIARETIINGATHQGARTGVPLASGLKNSIPQVLDACRLWGGSNSLAFSGMILCLDNTCIEEDRIMFADPNFFDFFGLEVIEGDANTALLQPNSMVITETTSLKYFGEKNPLGQVLRSDHDSGDYKVTAVVKDVPENTHFSFDFLLSFNSLSISKSTNWNSGITYAYVQLAPKSDLNEVEKQIQTIYKSNIDQDSQASLFLQKVTDIHLKSNINSELQANGSLLYVRLLSMAGILILVIGGVNFINLSGARAWDKAMETGIRKVFGARRSGVFLSFFSEGIMMVTLTISLSLVTVDFMFGLTNEYFDLSLDSGGIGMILLVGYGLMVAFLSSVYPSLWLFSLKIQTFLKGIPASRGSRFNIRDRLIVVQFMIAISLIIGTSVIGDQIAFIRQMNLGFEKERLLVINNAEAIPDLGSFKSSLLTNPNVHSVSRSNTVLGKWMAGPFAVNDLNDTEQVVRAWPLFTDDDFLTTYGIKLTAGPGFSSNKLTSQNEAIVNRRLLDGLGLKDIDGLRVNALGRDLTVVGLIEDVHYQSLHNGIAPLVMIGGDQSFGQRKKMTIKLSGTNMAETIAQIDAHWKAILPAVPFNFTFFDDDFSRLYENEVVIHKFSRVIGVISIVIAGIGLFGLSLFTAHEKRREIAIRKVLGASFINILKALTTKFGRLVVLAFVLAIPLSVLTMNGWLENFDNRISLTATHFILGFMVVILTVAISTSQLLYKAIRNNPIKNLREE